MRLNDDNYCTLPFTGDANFSESEVVDWLLELFGEDNVEVISGICSIQIAEAKSRVSLDKVHIEKIELLKAVMDTKSVILLARSWPKELTRNFMQSDIAFFLKKWNLYFIS